MIGKWLNLLDKKYAIGTLVGLMFGLLSVYTDFYRSNSPIIEFDIISNTTVVDLKENVGKLDVLYDGASILSKRQSLSLITIKISNKGNSSVFKNYYDSRFPLGFIVRHGIILEKPTIIQSSDSYIEESVGLISNGLSQISFSDFIFDKDEYFVIKILVLHPDGIRPEIVAKGKITGVKHISVIESYLNKETTGFWERIFEGSVLIQVTRFFAYLICFVFFTLAIILPIAFISDTYVKKKRQRKMKEFKIHLSRDFTGSEVLISRFFIDNGIGVLKRFNMMILQFTQYRKVFENVDPNLEFRHRSKRTGREDEMPTMDLISALKRKNYLSVENNSLVLRDNLDGFVSKLINFLETQY